MADHRVFFPSSCSRRAVGIVALFCLLAACDDGKTLTRDRAQAMLLDTLEPDVFAPLHAEDFLIGPTYDKEYLRKVVNEKLKTKTFLCSTEIDCEESKCPTVIGEATRRCHENRENWNWNCKHAHAWVESGFAEVRFFPEVYHFKGGSRRSYCIASLTEKAGPYRQPNGEYRLGEGADVTVTGIVQATSPVAEQSAMNVEYSYWIRPNELGRAWGWEDREFKMQAEFALYDDGWRIVGKPAVRW